MKLDEIKIELAKYVPTDLAGNVVVRHLHPLTMELLQMVEVKQADIDRQATLILDLLAAIGKAQGLLADAVKKV